MFTVYQALCQTPSHSHGHGPKSVLPRRGLRAAARWASMCPLMRTIRAEGFLALTFSAMLSLKLMLQPHERPHHSLLELGRVQTQAKLWNHKWPECTQFQLRRQQSCRLLCCLWGRSCCGGGAEQEARLCHPNFPGLLNIQLCEGDLGLGPRCQDPGVCMCVCVCVCVCICTHTYPQNHRRMWDCFGPH